MKVLTFLLSLVLVACYASGCKQVEGTETETDIAASKARAKDSVIAASKKLISLPSVSAIVEGEGKLGIRKDVKFVAPDRYHIVFDDETGARTEMITVGNETYLKAGDAWTKLSGDVPPTSTFRNNFTDEVAGTITDAVFEGEDNVNGKPALKYSYRLVTKVGNFAVLHRIWVDKGSGIPIKAVAEYTDDASQEKTLTTTFDPVTPVAIELPVK